MSDLTSAGKGLARSAVAFNESNLRSRAGGGGIVPQSMQNSAGQDLEGLFSKLDRYFAHRAGGIDPNKVKAQGTQVNYEF